MRIAEEGREVVGKAGLGGGGRAGALANGDKAGWSGDEEQRRETQHLCWQAPSPSRENLGATPSRANSCTASSLVICRLRQCSIAACTCSAGWGRAVGVLNARWAPASSAAPRGRPNHTSHAVQANFCRRSAGRPRRREWRRGGPPEGRQTLRCGETRHRPAVRRLQ